MKTVIAWGVAFALIAGAWLVSLATPEEVAWRDGFAIEGSIGAEISDRNVTVTVHDVTLADVVTDGSESFSRTEGAVWVVVDLSAQALTDETEGTIRHATLTIDGQEYRPSDRVRVGVDNATIFIAAPVTGSIVFEIPEPYAAKQAELRLGARWDVDNADTYLAFAVPLGDARRVGMFTVESPRVGY